MGTFGQIIVAIQNYGDEDKYQVVLTAEVGIDGQEMPGNVASLVKWFSEEGDAMSLGDALKGACDCLPSREVRAEVILGGETIELGEGAIGDSTQVYLRRCELEDGPVWQAYQARDEGCDPKDVTATDLPLNTT